MAPSEPKRVLVVDGEPGLAGDYRLALCGDDAPAQARDLGLADGLFAETVSRAALPEIELETCDRAVEAIERIDRGQREQRPFALAFIDPDTLVEPAGPELFESLRALDAGLYLVAATAGAEVDPVRIGERAPPVHRLHFLRKPIHAAEIQQLTRALTAQWQHDQARRRTPVSPADGAQPREFGPAAPLDALPAGILIFDAEDRLLEANDAVRRIFPELAGRFRPGVRYADIQRAVARRLLPEDTLYRKATWVRERLRWHAGPGGILEQRLRGPRWVLMAESRVDGGGTCCLFHDVTELRQRDRDRDTAARMAQMSQVIGTLTERLGGGREPDPPAADDKVVSLATVKEAARAGRSRRAASPAADPALFERLRAVGQLQGLKPAPQDLASLLDEVLRDAGQAVPKGIGVETRSEPDLWAVMVDRDGFQPALRALIDNACEAMAGLGTLRLEAANMRLTRDGDPRPGGLGQGDFVRLSIIDSGPGMPPELAERAFNPFFSSRSDGGRLGLGLSVVYGFVKQSGGHVEIDPARIRGTAVHLYLPRAEAGGGAVDSLDPAGR